MDLRFIVFLAFVLIGSACTRNLPPTASTTLPVEESGEAAVSSPAEQEETGASDPTKAAEGVEQTFENGQPLAAKVNDQPIFLETYEKQVSQFEQTLVEQGIDPTSESGQTAITQVQRQVLDALVDQVLIEQEAQRLGLAIPEETLESKVQESIDQAQGQEQFEAWLATNNLTLAEFKETLRFQLIANQMFEQITAEVPDSAEQIQLRQILVGDEAIARDIIAQLKTGANFAELAATHSLDESNRESGGSLGWFPRGANLVPPEVEEIAFSLEPNEVSGPIKTPLGYHIIQLEAKEAARPLAPEMVPVLKEERFSAWLMERRAASVIEKFVGS